MKIGQSPNTTPATSAAASTPAAATEAAKTTANAKDAAAAAPVDASSTVALSSTASSLLSSSGTGDFDAGKVDRLGAAIAAGTFSINPEAIADKLIANAQELLAKVKG